MGAHATFGRSPLTTTHGQRRGIAGGESAKCIFLHLRLTYERGRNVSDYMRGRRGRFSSLSSEGTRDKSQLCLVAAFLCVPHSLAVNCVHWVQRDRMIIGRCRALRVQHPLPSRLQVYKRPQSVQLRATSAVHSSSIFKRVCTRKTEQKKVFFRNLYVRLCTQRRCNPPTPPVFCWRGLL